MHPKKSLGQNFLTSKETAGRIVRAATLSPGDVVLEVGPGKGILTELLLETGAVVFAIEKDPRMVLFLKEKFADKKNFTITEGDILDSTVHDVLPDTYSIVANLPYYITSHFLRLFLEELRKKPVSMTLMVQREVADRIIARPPHMSLLSLSVQAFGTPKKILNVSRKQFSPPPDVNSAVITIQQISDAFFIKNNTTPQEFFPAIKKAFSQKRKMLRSSIGIAGKCSTKRPQELSLQNWLDIVPLIKNAL
ncbi:MAG: ribosomal RNA small subunit methyltransferase A [Candidatus Ryanbacteria bacterium CG10_big_fil_rev_8_21_14_0_10_43_42]|uniref:Ribosomal RNA small subunit methyltransferase A n=1 Tax=Candidatus Ryanbacteria bacterium CG10_big_fil_rev_8_21_14_0_10_43_42 TaxID=1974864 RepID=A0A2M8KW84_9BACT|nr:MAG: ribosomal RNA small subunit methyltransferase A [Candidatus Ryanbacteria bacterium CG10_big_fil_rev_8_21_14_0_10_43_42]